MAERETHARSIAKAVSWRISGSLFTTLLAWVFTGSIGLSIGIGVTEFFVKIGIFYLHERAWHRCRFGIVDSEAETTSEGGGGI